MRENFRWSDQTLSLFVEKFSAIFRQLRARKNSCISNKTTTRLKPSVIFSLKKWIYCVKLQHLFILNSHIWLAEITEICHLTVRYKCVTKTFTAWYW